MAEFTGTITSTVTITVNFNAGNEDKAEEKLQSFIESGRCNLSRLLANDIRGWDVQEIDEEFELDSIEEA